MKKSGDAHLLVSTSFPGWRGSVEEENGTGLIVP